MQATLDKTKRRKLRQQIQENIGEIVLRIDELERETAALKNHLHMHDRFFFEQSKNLQESEEYGSTEDLVDLYLDTVRMISQLERARVQVNSASIKVHYYDYSTNQIFNEFAQAEAESL